MSDTVANRIGLADAGGVLVLGVAGGVLLMYSINRYRTENAEKAADIAANVPANNQRGSHTTTYVLMALAILLILGAAFLIYGRRRLTQIVV